MPGPQISTKRLAISKANAQMVAVVGIAAFVSIFTLVASQAVWSNFLYQGRVTKAKTTAKTQLKNNIKAYDELASSYELFNSNPTNAIGGSSTGDSDKDGTNAKIILDALPNSYDFPALTSSLEKILADRNLTVSSITGTDDQLAQQSNIISPNPQPVPMPFSFTVTGANYDSIQKLMNTLQVSIRPIQVDTMTVSGGGDNMKLTVNAHTYFQPGKSLTITKTEIK